MPETFPCTHCRHTLYYYLAGEPIVRCPACSEVTIVPRTFRQQRAGFTLLPVSARHLFDAPATAEIQDTRCIKL